MKQLFFLPLFVALYFPFILSSAPAEVPSVHEEIGNAPVQKRVSLPCLPPKKGFRRTLRFNFLMEEPKSKGKCAVTEFKLNGKQLSETTADGRVRCLNELSDDKTGKVRRWKGNRLYCFYGDMKTLGEKCLYVMDVEDLASEKGENTLQVTCYLKRKDLPHLNGTNRKVFCSVSSICIEYVQEPTALEQKTVAPPKPSGTLVSEEIRTESVHEEIGNEPIQKRVSLPCLPPKKGFRRTLRFNFLMEEPKSKGKCAVTEFKLNGKLLSETTADGRVRCLNEMPDEKTGKVRTWKGNRLYSFYGDMKTLGEKCLYIMDVEDLASEKGENTLQVTCYLKRKDLPHLKGTNRKVFCSVSSICIEYMQDPTALEQKTVELPKLTGTPVPDGSLTSVSGKETLLLPLSSGKKKMNEPGSVRIAWTDQALYIGADFPQDMTKLRTSFQYGIERDSKIWIDDNIDIRIAPYGNKDYFHLIINSAGIIYDAFNSDQRWNSDAVIRTKLLQDRWRLEVLIPFEQLGFTPKGGELWQIGIGRYRAWDRTFAAARPMTANSFQSAMFPVLFKTDRNPAVILKAVDRFGERLTEIEFSQKGDYTAELALSDKVKKDNVKSGAKLELAWPESQATVSELQIKVSCTEGKLLYENRIRFLHSDVHQAEVWYPKKKREDLPLKKVTWKDDLSFSWITEMNLPLMTNFALQYGVEYSIDDAFQYYHDSRMMPVCNNSVMARWEKLKQKRELQITPAVYPTYGSAKVLVTKKGRMFLPDPAVKKVYLEALDTILKNKESWNVGRVFFGDEVLRRVARAGVELFKKHGEEYPFLANLDRQLKQTYGWGIPDSLSDPHAGRWIAYYRWLNSDLSAFQREVAVRCAAAGLSLMEENSAAEGNEQDFASLRGIGNMIATVQLSSGNEPDLVPVIYYTQKIKDLTGFQRVEPCLHVERYLANYSMKDTLQLFSQAAIGGATGIHRYPTDVMGRSFGATNFLISDRYGAPERDALVVKTLQNFRTPAEPKADLGFWVSQYTLWSSHEHHSSRELTAYSMLGAHAGAWMRIINETILQTYPEKLDGVKAIFVSDAAYERPEDAKALLAFAQKGGTLIVADPTSFSKTDKDTPGTGIPGIELIKKVHFRQIQLENEQLGLDSDGYILKKTENWHTIAAFDGKQPAILEREYGKGKIVFFAFEPFNSARVKNLKWREFAIRFLKRYGIGTGHDVWSFSFPEKWIGDADNSVKAAVGRCLTGNHIRWKLYQADTRANKKLPKAVYSYSRKPDITPDKGGWSNISFAKGCLTDRAQLVRGAELPSETRDSSKPYVCAFSTSEPMTLTFDFKEPVSCRKVVIFCAGTWSGAALYASSDGKDYQLSGRNDAAKNLHPEEVKKITLNLNQVKAARFFQLRFSASAEKKKIILAEVEFWE